LAIIINIDVMLAKRKMSVTELADKVGITLANISILKNGKAKAIRLSTLEAICKALQCQPGDRRDGAASQDLIGWSRVQTSYLPGRVSVVSRRSTASFDLSSVRKLEGAGPHACQKLS